MTHPKKRNFALSGELVKRLAAEFTRTRAVPNPYRPGSYYFIVEALKALGSDRPHPFDVLRSKVRELMGAEAWRAFAHQRRHGLGATQTREQRGGGEHVLLQASRSLRPKKDYGLKLVALEAWRAFERRSEGRPETSQTYEPEADANRRLHQNCRVLQRTNDYGLTLLQVGAIIMGTRGCVIDLVHNGNEMTYALNTDSGAPRYDPRALILGNPRHAPSSIAHAATGMLKCSHAQSTEREVDS